MLVRLRVRVRDRVRVGLRYGARDSGNVRVGVSIRATPL